MQALIAPTEAGYSLNEIKRAALIYDKIFILDPGDRDLFPDTAFALAMGMPPVMSWPGTGSVRPMGKTATYDSEFDALLEICKPLTEAGVLEVTSTWNRLETDSGTFTLGSVPLGGYPLNVQAVLNYYRALARDNAMLRDALDGLAIDLASSPNAALFSKQGEADGSINNDPHLPLLEGPLQREQLREVLTIIARGRVATSLKLWGVAEQRGLVPVLPEPSAAVMDRLGASARAAIDAADPDPYWARRTAILDTVIGEFVPDEMLSKTTPKEILKFRTKAMRKAAADRTKLFAELREMAGEATNLNLGQFKDKMRDKLKLYDQQLVDLKSERKALAWSVVLDVGKGASASAAAAFAAGGLFHVAFPASISAALFAATAWSLGKVQENMPALRKLLADEKAIKGANEFAVFRRLRGMTNL